MDQKTFKLTWTAPLELGGTQTPLLTGSLNSQPVTAWYFNEYSYSVTVSGSNAVTWPSGTIQVQISDDEGKQFLGSMGLKNDITNWRPLPNTKLVISGNIANSGSDTGIFDSIYDAAVSGSFGLPKSHGTQGTIQARFMRLSFTPLGTNTVASLTANMTLKQR